MWQQGWDADEHLRNLEKVFSSLQQAGLRLKRCLYPLQLNIWVMLLTRRACTHHKRKLKQSRMLPDLFNNTTELKVYLGLLTYYGKFLPNLATTLVPFIFLAIVYKRTPNKFRAVNKKRPGFVQSKELLTSESLLVYYDLTKELIHSCDASQYGLGAAVLLQVYDKQEKRHICPDHC